MQELRRQSPDLADQAYSLRQTYGFTDPGNNYYYNIRGLQEKYLQGSGGTRAARLPARQHRSGLRPPARKAVLRQEPAEHSAFGRRGQSRPVKGSSR